MSRVYVFHQYGGPEVEELTERAIPEPGPGELLVEVRAAGVNPVDWKIREGYLGSDRTLPSAMGREVAGVVIAVGPQVNDFAVGDAILGTVAPGDGGFADHTLVRAAEAVAKPDEMSFAAAATIPVAGTTAYDLTHQVALEQGQSLLILGAGGGVGHLATQIGGVHQFRVIGVASTAKRELVESTGATFVAAGDHAAATVRELAPQGVDLLIDLVGGQPLRALAALAKSPERLVTAADPGTAAELGGTGRVRDPESLEKITSVIDSEVVNPLISDTYPLERARAALAIVEAGHAAGKIVIVP